MVLESSRVWFESSTVRDFDGLSVFDGVGDFESMVHRV